MDYIQLPIKILKDAKLEFRLIGPSDTQPIPAASYTIYSEPIEVSKVIGRFWIEYKIIE